MDDRGVLGFRHGNHTPAGRSGGARDVNQFAGSRKERRNQFISRHSWRGRARYLPRGISQVSGSSRSRYRLFSTSVARDEASVRGGGGDNLSGPRDNPLTSGDSAGEYLHLPIRATIGYLSRLINGPRRCRRIPIEPIGRASRNVRRATQRKRGARTSLLPRTIPSLNQRTRVNADSPGLAPSRGSFPNVIRVVNENAILEGDNYSDETCIDRKRGRKREKSTSRASPAFGIV